MRSFFENRIAFAAIFSSFAIAFAWNVTQEGGPVSHRPLIRLHQFDALAHGPMIPPDPWAGGSVTAPVTIAHGPMIPPDPWAGGSVAAV